MQINLSGHHIELTQPLRDYVNEKLERITRHYDRVTDIHVILSVEKQTQKAEATIHVAGNTLFAHAEDEDMYAAIDALADKLDRQILKHKQKQQDRRNHNAPGPDAAAS